MNLTRKDKIMYLIKLLLLSVALAVAVGNGYAAADNNKIEPIKMRWASDHTGPPHPAAIAEVFFAEQVEKRIPGSKIQFFWGKSR